MEKIKLNIFRAFVLILLLGTFSIIFGFSNQDAKTSSGISRKVTELITNNIKWIKEKPEKEREKIVYNVEKIVRKLAHFSIYTLVRIFINDANYNI